MEKTLMTEIDGLIAKAWDDLKDAADKKDAAALAPLHARMAELSKMKKDLQGIILRVRELTGMGTAKDGRISATPGLRRIRIKVTDGMINQNLLTLTEARRHGLVRRGESFEITPLPSGQKFRTELLRVGNRLQERSLIGRFYRDANVQAGDVIELIETAPDCWQLKAADKVDPGDFLKPA